MSGFRPRFDSTLLSNNAAVLDMADADVVAPDSPAVELMKKNVHFFFRSGFERLFAQTDVDIEANLN